MKIVKISGGLGNQMFQYAFARSMQEKTGEAVLIDTTLYDSFSVHNGFELDLLFTCILKKATVQEIDSLASRQNNLLSRFRRKYFRKMTHYLDTKGGYQPELLETISPSGSTNCYYEGYWQTEKYFQEIADVIRKDFSFKKNLSEKSTKLFSRIDENTASVHIRHGDYANLPNFNSICTENYYKNAFKYLFEHRTINKVVVFSNDITWCKEKLPELIKNSKKYESVLPEIIFVDWNTGADSWQDMALMSYCGCNIISNSTFSWWGAWLNNNTDKIVLAPEIWARPRTKGFYKYNYNYVLPNSWIKVEY